MYDLYRHYNLRAAISWESTRYLRKTTTSHSNTVLKCATRKMIALMQLIRMVGCPRFYSENYNVVGSIDLPSFGSEIFVLHSSGLYSQY